MNGNKVIAFDSAVDELLNVHITLTGMGYAEAARACGVSAPVLKLVEKSKYSPPQSPQTWGEVVDPDGTPFPKPPLSLPEGDDVEILPSDEDSVMALVVVNVNSRQRIVAKVWDDGLVRVFDSAFGPDDGQVYLKAIRVAYEMVGGGLCQPSS